MSGVTDRRKSGRGGMRSWIQTRAVPAVSAPIEKVDGYGVRWEHERQLSLRQKQNRLAGSHNQIRSGVSVRLLRKQKRGLR